MSNSHRLRIDLRLGVASIEFLMFIPVLIAFSMVTMYVIRIHQAQQVSTLDAEIQEVESEVLTVQEHRLASTSAWQGRVSSDLKQLVRAFQPNLDIKAGLVIGTGTHETGGTGAGSNNGVFQDAGPAENSIRLLSHAWESEVLPFPTASSEQPELTFPASVRGLAPSIRNLSLFTALKSFGYGTTSSQSSNEPPPVAQLRKEAEKSVANDLATIRQQIANLEKRLNNPGNSPEENASLNMELTKFKGYETKLNGALKQQSTIDLTHDLDEH